MVRSVGVPCEEAGEVLDRSHGLVAADYRLLVDSPHNTEPCLHTSCRDKLEVVAHHRVVDERICHHLEGVQEAYSNDVRIRGMDNNFY